MIDFNLAGIGETSNPLIQLVQDVETVMTSKLYDIIPDKSIVVDLEQYLFKYGVQTSTLAKQIKLMLSTACTNTENFEIDVACEMLSTQGHNDMLYIQIQLTGSTTNQHILEYAVSRNLNVARIPD